MSFRNVSHLAKQISFKEIICTDKPKGLHLQNLRILATYEKTFT